MRERFTRALSDLFKSVKAVGGCRGWSEPGAEEPGYCDSPAARLGISYRECMLLTIFT